MLNFVILESQKKKPVWNNILSSCVVYELVAVKKNHVCNTKIACGSKCVLTLWERAYKRDEPSHHFSLYFFSSCYWYYRMEIKYRKGKRKYFADKEINL